MELHQLAAVILVEAFRRILSLRLGTHAGDRGQVSRSAWTETCPRPAAERAANDSRRAHFLVRTVWIGAHPVVEIKEHGRTFRDRLEQIAKLAEHTRADDVALVLGEHEPRRTLPGVDVEVIEPEIRQHFLQLTLAVNRADDFLLAELDDDEVGALLHRVGRSRLRVLFVLRCGILLALFPGLDLRDLVLLGDVARAQRQRRQPCEPRLDVRVVELFRTKLLGDVLLHAERPNPRQIARPWPEADAVEHVENQPVIVLRRRDALQVPAAGQRHEGADDDRRNSRRD